MKSCKIKALAFGLVVSTALSGAALAADVEAYTPHDWTGLYLGGHVGYGWVDLNGRWQTEDANEGSDFFDGGEGSFKLDDDGILAGLQIGYNHQIDNVVLGVEADISFVDWKDSLTNFENERIVSHGVV